MENVSTKNLTYKFGCMFNLQDKPSELLKPWQSVLENHDMIEEKAIVKILQTNSNKDRFLLAIHNEHTNGGCFGAVVHFNEGVPTISHNPCSGRAVAKYYKVIELIDSTVNFG